jgi:hypothetical protein
MKYVGSFFILFWAASSLVLASSGVSDLVTFKAEYPVLLENLPVSLPDAIEQEVFNGDREIRQQIQYDAPSRQLIVWTFLASPSWPRPATLLDVQNNQLDQFRVDVSDIRLTGGAWTTIEFNGAVATPVTTALMVAGGYGTSLMGALPGLPARLVSSFVMGSSNNVLTNTVLAVTGGTHLVTPMAIGYARIEASPNRAPVASVISPPTETAAFEISFDATASHDPDGDELDYKWHVLGGTLSLRGCETPTPVFQFNSGTGTYDFRLTLTDARGATTITTYRVQYTGR